MSDPMHTDECCWHWHSVAMHIAAWRATARGKRQRVAVLPADDPRRTLDLCRFVVTDA
jgi:hypothetical protein